MGYARLAFINSLRVFAVFAVLAGLATAGCTRPDGSPGSAIPAAKERLSGSSSSSDSWPTFAYDYARTGYNAAVTHLTKSNVSRLQLRWKQNVGDQIFASPVTFAGNLIVVTRGDALTRTRPIVYDFRTSDGSLLWKFRMNGGEGQMTPTIDPDAGLVIVADEQKQIRRRGPSHVYALRLLDGSVAWSQQIVGLLRASPVVTGGSVYMGRAGGDPPLCLQGGITALDESTGAIEWTWSVDPQPNEGGSVWGAIAFDGAHLIFGTGNTCVEPIPTANGAVALNLDGTPLWDMVAVKNSSYDSDTGGGVMLYNGRAHFINKNGRFYAVSPQTGNIAWYKDLDPDASKGWTGGFATPTTDGSTMVEDSGLYRDGTSGGGGEFCQLTAARPTEVFPGFHSKLQGMDLNGSVLWSRTTLNRLVGYVALAGGVGFVGFSEDFVGLDLSTGKTLWKYPTSSYINASMIVVPSGVYGADDDGNVYAFGLPAKK